MSFFCCFSIDSLGSNIFEHTCLYTQPTTASAVPKTEMAGFFFFPCWNPCNNNFRMKHDDVHTTAAMNRLFIVKGNIIEKISIFSIGYWTIHLVTYYKKAIQNLIVDIYNQQNCGKRCCGSCSDRLSDICSFVAPFVIQISYCTLYNSPLLLTLLRHRVKRTSYQLSPQRRKVDLPRQVESAIS